MKTFSILLFPVLIITGHARTRKHIFDVKTKYVPLKQSMPSDTIIGNEWPSHDRKLPKYVAIAAAKEDTNILMSEPIHIIQGEELEVTLINGLMTSGMSIHWHGFEMKGKLEYDGVVGITQCALPPGETMTYRFQVDETPGTYFYHSHSGSLGVNAINKIKAPLIVHPRSRESTDLLDNMYNKHTSDTSGSYNALTSYGNERILFFSDGFFMSSAQKGLVQVGGLNPAVSKNDDGFTVGSFPFQYGTVNGKLREIVQVVAGENYKFRLLNGGSLYAFRISIDGIPLKIVAADSEPVEPYTVDEVILHSAERFDVEVTIPSDIPANSSIWIRADTLESVNQGYQNGVRAILHVVDSLEDEIGSPPTIFDVKDPAEDVAAASTKAEDRLTMNCNSRIEREAASESGDCLPISDLVAARDSYETASSPPYAEAHTIDFQFSPAPLFAHFTRIDGGNWNQHVNPVKSHFLDRNLALHENTAMLHLPPFSTVLLVWRNKSLMDHPMHLHGYKMEVLDTFIPKQEEACSRSECQLPSIYDSEAFLEELSTKPVGSGVTKDTFILPAGGAVVTRIKTLEPAIWFAHCHVDAHKEDGMALIVNVGNYTPPINPSWLPDDFPSCDHPFHEELREKPACSCYQDADAVLGRGLTSEHRCSRDYLCSHSLSEVANLESYKPSGVSMRSQYALPNYGISLIIACVICIVTFAIWKYSQIVHEKAKKDALLEGVVDEPSSLMRQIKKATGTRHLINEPQSLAYFMRLDFFSTIRVLAASQFKEYRPGCVNLLRVVEVTSLGALVGILFYDVGNNTSATSLSQKSGLLFFSVTLWTFTRMYPAVGRTNVWFKLAIDFSSAFSRKRDRFTYSVSLWLARCIAAFACEAWWPFLHVFVAYPLAGMFGRIDACFGIAFFLMMNNLCYISIGSLLGVMAPNVSIGMIISTVVSQTSLLAAGFYTTLPPVVNLIRYISPVYWTYSGILKTSFRSTDTFSCYKGGQSDVGVNQCYIEQSAGIDILKRRGINVATSNDANSESIWKEALVLVLLYIALNLAVLAVLLIKSLGRKNGEAALTGKAAIKTARKIAEGESQVNTSSVNKPILRDRLTRGGSCHNLAYLSEVTNGSLFLSAADQLKSPNIQETQKSSLSMSISDAGRLYLEDDSSDSDNGPPRPEHVLTEDSDSFSSDSSISLDVPAGNEDPEMCYEA